MFCNVIILIHHFDHIDLEREQNSFQLTKETFEKRVPRPDKKYPYGGSDKNFLPAMKGLTNDPKWLMVCLGREGKRKAAKTRGKVFRITLHAHVRARRAKSPATQATHKNTLTRSTPSGGLIRLYSCYVHIYYHAIIPSWSGLVHIKRVFLIL